MLRFRTESPPGEPEVILGLDINRPLSVSPSPLPNSSSPLLLSSSPLLLSFSPLSPRPLLDDPPPLRLISPAVELSYTGSPSAIDAQSSAFYGPPMFSTYVESPATPASYLGVNVTPPVREVDWPVGSTLIPDNRPRWLLDAIEQDPGPYEYACGWCKNKYWNHEIVVLHVDICGERMQKVEAGEAMEFMRKAEKAERSVLRVNSWLKVGERLKIVW